MKLLALLTLVGCAATETTCPTTWSGLSWTQVLPGTGTIHRAWTCDKFYEVVQEGMWRLYSVADQDSRFAKGGKNTDLTGWEVIGHPGSEMPAMSASGIKPSKGVTDCWNDRIHITLALAPFQSALVHEMAHAIQRCVPTQQDDGEDADHQGWTAIGLRQVINQLKNEKLGTEPELP